MTPDQQNPDRGPRISSWQRAKLRMSLSVALSTIQVTERFSPFSILILRKENLGWSGTYLPPLFSFDQHHERASARICPYASKTLYIYKHSCLLRNSNPGPATQQSASLTLYWMDDEKCVNVY
ncbi:hypothetical protein TNCV_3325141 [Trichonephila clavipes]|nr:hypothetical protein TNCV_3325141 [Trichonephila clavipes]